MLIMLLGICSILLVVTAYAVVKADDLQFANSALHVQLCDAEIKHMEDVEKLDYYRRFFREATDAGFAPTCDE